MIGLLNFIPGMLKLGGKLIVDKDKQAEYAFKVMEMTDRFAQKMLETKTYPWIDGLVKLAYAGESIVKGLFRPLGTAAMFAYAIYAETNGIVLSEGIQAILYGAFPAWGVSRHHSKNKELELKSKDNSWDWDDD